MDHPILPIAGPASAGMGLVAVADLLAASGQGLSAAAVCLGAAAAFIHAGVAISREVREWCDRRAAEQARILTDAAGRARAVVESTAAVTAAALALAAGPVNPTNERP